MNDELANLAHDLDLADEELNDEMENKFSFQS